MTILFADVVGSTALIQGRDDEDAQRLLDGAVQRMVDAVHRYDGTVSRRMGDGLMAMFGAPVAHEDHAVRASFAALAMLGGVRAYADEVRKTHSAEIQIRVGLNSGGVIVRLISNDRHLDYTAMGETVHLASRMEQQAAPDTALVSPVTRALVEGFVEVRGLGLREVKGFERPVEVCELVGVGTARTRLQATSVHGLTPFVGREAERAAIEQALARAEAGQGQVVALVAEPGVGKSRLVWEVTRSDRASAMRVLQTGAVSYGQTTTWLPVIDLLRSYFQIESRDAHAVMREKVAAGLLALDPTLEAVMPPLLALLDVPIESSASAAEVAWAQRDPALRRRATLDAVRQLLLCESRRQPLLLVFEDLHWIDSETQALLDGLVESLPTARILLLVNYRPEYSHTWGKRSAYAQFRLDPLGEHGAGELLDALLGSDASIGALRSLLIERTEGTPLFLEESVRALVETGALAGERGSYRLTRPVDEIRVPATVQTVLAARIDRLLAEEKRLLQTAAVVGKDVPFRLVRRVVEQTEADLHAQLSRLQAAELLYPVQLFPELEYTFKHALIHDVAYDSLLQDHRRRLHGRIVAAIEAEYGDRLEEHLEQLAHHALQSQDWPRAVTYARSAGQKAAGRWAYREALAWLERALEALPHLPDSRETRELGVDIRIELRHALSPISVHDRSMGYLRDAAEVAESLGDRGRLSAVYGMMMHHLRNLGEYDTGIGIGRWALKLNEGLGDDVVEAFIHMQLGQTYLWLGELQEAADGFRMSVGHYQRGALVERFGLSRATLLPSLGTLGRCLAELGGFDEAVEYSEEAMRGAEQAGDPLRIANTLNGFGRIHIMRGELERARPLIERSLVIARGAGVTNPQVWDVAQLGLIEAMIGDPDDGVRQMEAGIELSHATGNTIGLADRTVWLAEGYLLSGRLDDARRSATEALNMAVAQRERIVEAYALRTLGEIVASAGSPEAETRYREALMLAEEIGLRPLQTRCHVGLGALYRRVDRLDEARTELMTAVEMMREMGMTRWLREAEAELAQCAVTWSP